MFESSLEEVRALSMQCLIRVEFYRLSSLILFGLFFAFLIVGSFQKKTLSEKLDEHVEKEIEKEAKRIAEKIKKKK